MVFNFDYRNKGGGHAYGIERKKSVTGSFKMILELSVWCIKNIMYIERENMFYMLQLHLFVSLNKIVKN